MYKRRRETNRLFNIIAAYETFRKEYYSHTESRLLYNTYDQRPRN